MVGHHGVDQVGDLELFVAGHVHVSSWLAHATRRICHQRIGHWLHLLLASSLCVLPQYIFNSRWKIALPLLILSYCVSHNLLTGAFSGRTRVTCCSSVGVSCKLVRQHMVHEFARHDLLVAHEALLRLHLSALLTAYAVRLGIERIPCVGKIVSSLLQLLVAS